MQKSPPPVKVMGPGRFFAIIGIFVGALCLVAGIIGMFGSGSGAPTSSSDQAVAEATAGQSLLAAPKPTRTPRPTATPLPGVGDAVVLDGVTLKVVRAENAGQVFSTDERETPIETSGMFVWLTVEVTNTGKEPIALHSPNLTDSSGREFNTHEDSVWYMPHDELCSLDTLNPGLTKTCSYLFELPADATGLAALLKTSLFGDGVRVSLYP